MKIATYLIDDEAESLNFAPQDLTNLHGAFPEAEITHHSNEKSFLQDAATVDVVLTWHFDSAWYENFGILKTIYTPAAGRDWVAVDPDGRIPVVHGTFHGPILGESLLSAMLFMNHRMPEMIRNHEQRQWNRNLQSGSRLLQGQTILIIGLGHIGSCCAAIIKPFVTSVIGVRRTQKTTSEEIPVYGIEALPQLLPGSDHVVLLLPGDPTTDRFMNSERLSLMKTGSYVYNFGRGNSLLAADLIPAMKRLGGAFLDVTEEEPLPENSPLWYEEKIFITPHSSCMYADYTERYVAEVIQQIKRDHFGARR